eukprot:gene19900-7020_t
MATRSGHAGSLTGWITESTGTRTPPPRMIEESGLIPVFHLPPTTYSHRPLKSDPDAKKRSPRAPPSSKSSSVAPTPTRRRSSHGSKNIVNTTIRRRSSLEIKCGSKDAVWIQEPVWQLLLAAR